MKSKTREIADSAVGDVSLTRLEIKEAAKRLIAIQGYAATTVRQIAQTVSMKGGSLYYHFGSKDEILFSIFDEGNRLLLDAAERVLKLNLKDPPAILRKLIQEHVRILANDPDQFKVVTTELNRLEGERRKRIFSQRDKYERVIQDVLTRGIKERSIRPCNVKVTSYGMIALLNGVAYWYKLGGTLTIEQIAEQFSLLLLKGLRI